MIPHRKPSNSESSESFPDESNQGNNLRQLLPAVRPPPVDHHTYASVPLTRKRSSTSLACDPCRQRKTKCNGSKPACSQCRVRKLECVYRPSLTADYRDKYETLVESHPAAVVYRAIQTRPQAEALEIFRRIQSGVDAETLMLQLTSADLLLQVQLEPETRSRYQFIYSPLMPAYLQTTDNPFMKSLIHEWSDRDDASTIAAPRLPESDLGHRAQYLRPHHAAVIIDSRLDDIIPSKWTSVHASDDIMRSLIRAYFLQEYDWFTFFHKDHFLDDMVTESNTFCSPLLVNAVLAVGCQCKNYFSEPAEFWNPNSLGSKFLDEARRLWILEITDQRSLTTVQAALVLNTVVNMFDMDSLSSAYIVQATKIARELGLFESTTYIMNKNLQNSYDLTAWSLFHWQCTLSFQLMTTPLIQTPPKSPVPDPERDPDWFGEIWLKYPSGSVLVPLQCGLTFKAKMDFSVILNEAMFEIDKDSNKDFLTRNGATRIIAVTKKLDHWYHNLPKSLSPTSIVFPSQLKLHLQHCYVMIQLYEIIVPQHSATPKEHLQASLSKYRGYFETILRIHYLRHSFEYGNMMLTRFLAMLAFLALNKINSLNEKSTLTTKPTNFDVGDSDPKEARATLLMAQKGLSDQGRGYYLPRTLLRDIISHMSVHDANVLQSFITIPQEGPGKVQERKLYMESHCPPDILRLANDASQQPDENWIRRFTILTLGEKSGLSILGMISGGKDGRG
ncbi:related to nitrate assimilation regulatory protein nirA [Fusarium torulosum]|uniref:Related to nitrate assimilation regulatory protein nirA n=1 Tax=Fusarium torulosum TaxID=33205 RepID=A0AAE8MFH4_9HYPO|nr:related to nitrate assimilation regulatory protein nirA [Fusarium torulosum]